ncbi:MAG: transporter [Saprospiraceae bacterium]|nr:transporter [Saprospiraceae bacterium]
MNRILPLFLLAFVSIQTVFAQTDSIALEKLRTESGVDPTRVQSRISYTFLAFDQEGDAAQINNRSKLNLGVNRWSLSLTYELVSRSPGTASEGFSTGSGDLRFSILNAFWVKGKHALAASAEFFTPTGKPGFGNQYFSATPALTYSYSINPSLVLAVQPQYTFDLFKVQAYPDLSVVTIRAFLAKFTRTGYFFVFEPRPVFDLENDENDLVLSPIVGKAIGAGFNLVFLMEYSLNEDVRNRRGTLYQVGFNKNF